MTLLIFTFTGALMESPRCLDLIQSSHVSLIILEYLSDSEIDTLGDGFPFRTFSFNDLGFFGMEILTSPFSTAVSPWYRDANGLSGFEANAVNTLIKYADDKLRIPESPKSMFRRQLLISNFFGCVFSSF